MNRTLPVAMVVAIVCILAETTTSALRHPGGEGAAATEFPGDHVVQGLVQYDSGWYGEIAQRGYWAVPPNTQSPTAFFPLYPMLMRGLVLVGVNHFVAGILLSLIFGLSALFLFSKWAAERTTPGLGNDAGLLFALYPFAFYLYGVVYSDGLFLLLAVSAFYALEKRQVGLATLLGILATATRPVAPAMIVGLVVRNFELQRSRNEPLGIRTVLPALSAIGMLLYMAYLWRTFGDAELFVHAQSAPGWNNTPGLHAWLKVEFFKALRHPMGPMHVVRLLTHAGVALAALLLAWPTKKLLGWGYALYVLAAVGLPTLSSHDFQGLGRYVMAAFPIFLTLAALVRERPRLRIPVLATFAVGIVILAASFGDGQYVA